MPVEKVLEKCSNFVKMAFVLDFISILFFFKFLKILKKLFTKSFFSGVWGEAPKINKSICHFFFELVDLDLSQSI